MRLKKLDNKIKEKIDYEISKINKLLSEGKPLIDLCKKNKELDFIYKSAAGSFLHSFYNGIESIILLILKSMPENIPNDTQWHKKLLDRAFEATEERPALFNNENKKQLEDYMRFRHLFRHTYEYELDPIKLIYLINGVEKLWENIKNDINIFANHALHNNNTVK